MICGQFIVDEAMLFSSQVDRSLYQLNNKKYVLSRIRCRSKIPGIRNYYVEKTSVG